MADRPSPSPERLSVAAVETRRLTVAVMFGSALVLGCGVGQPSNGSAVTGAAGPSRSGGDPSAGLTVVSATAPTTTTVPTTTIAPTTTTLPTTSMAPTTTTAPMTSQPTADTTVAPQFQFSSVEIGPDLAQRINPTSWRDGCPVELTELRYLTVSYWGADGAVHEGELMVHRDVVEDMRIVFGAMFADQFPINQMRLVDDFGGDDDESIAANNTSAFNCRPVTGGTGWSRHAYGKAIDINPLWNPYVVDGEVLPPTGAPFVDRRTLLPGMISDGDVVVRTFDELGWRWGGRFQSLVDWQHFDKGVG